MDHLLDANKHNILTTYRVCYSAPRYIFFSEEIEQ